MPLMEMDSWPMLAKCRGLQDDLFPDGADQKRARTICFGCEVRAECLAEALDTNRVTVYACVPYFLSSRARSSSTRAIAAFGGCDVLIEPGA